MNDDENTKGPQPWSDPALEARVVASVLGETSAFEASELERILAGNPELAIFKRRIGAVHTLVGVAFLPRQPKIQLSPGRRQQLLEKLGARPAQPGKKVKAFALPFPQWLSSDTLNRVVACLVILAFVAVLYSLSLPAITGALMKSPRRSIASSPNEERPQFHGEAGGFLAADGLDRKASVGIGGTTAVSSVSESVTDSAGPSSKPDSSGKKLAAVEATAIKAFTSGWGKGSGSGTGARGGVAAVEAEKQVLRDAGDVSAPGAEAVPMEPAKAKASGKDRDPAFQAEIKTTRQPFSTFSLHVSDVSFQLAKDALAKGAMPDPGRIRAEEFYNAFDYSDPAPAPGEEVACRIEQCAHPFQQQRELVRIALKVAAAGRAAGQPLRLTILLDTSGSMEREDRAESVRRALQTLASLLGPDDRVTLIGFARTPRLLAEQVPGNQAGKLAEMAARTPSEGGTNLEMALDLASELALKQKLPAAQNRIVLLTDGAANLGDADPARLARQIEKTRQQGISFDACGVGANGLNDEMLEALTRKGDGRYYFLNRPEDADAGFSRQLAGALRPAAENVKVQVVFNPARVSQYRLIGFEKHLLKKEDFRNDKVQAAELSAEEAGVAVYQVQTLPEGEGELGEVFVRFRDPANGMMVERSWTMPYEAKAPAFDKAPPSMQLAATAALLAERLRGDSRVDLDTMAPVIAKLRGQYSHQAKVGDLIRMFEKMRR
ncbi:MAG: von Willebrand factor type A domain-containing protein [Terrimicrobiaceae bacterium]